MQTFSNLIQVEMLSHCTAAHCTAGVRMLSAEIHFITAAGFAWTSGSYTWGAKMQKLLISAKRQRQQLLSFHEWCLAPLSLPDSDWSLLSWCISPPVHNRVCIHAFMHITHKDKRQVSMSELVMAFLCLRASERNRVRWINQTYLIYTFSLRPVHADSCPAQDKFWANRKTLCPKGSGVWLSLYYYPMLAWV